ncbi:hypothetical protein Lalb_Chr16g0392621 [Lupinus albus]|uniref:Reverse transcriptase zinc-binding domain-containing protein n=1 Tax=Lupinus albus TaxID=3870 RepID=A0A6A4PCZ5_LUPAL|nr:hypothetical protein Lalb_Chr16g0392621 [Lupinus albus]
MNLIILNTSSLKVFSLPKKVLQYLKPKCRNFLWCGKEQESRKAHVAWDHLCDPKQVGCLNLIALVEWNKVNMIKLLWNLTSKSYKLWVRWINA